MAPLEIRNFLRFHLPAFLSAFIVLAITLFVYYETSEKLVEKNQSLFLLRTDVAKSAIEKRIKDYEQILKGAQSLFRINDSVTLQEWKIYIGALEVETRYPGIQGIGYTVFLPAAKVPGFTEQMRSAGFANFHVWPEYARDYYSSIIYLEPNDFRNQRAFGFDMYTNATRQKAMTKAMDSGQPALSGMVTLVQETSTKVQKGFLLYLPVYQHDTEPTTISERRKLIQGFVYSPFRMDDLMQGILHNRFSDLHLRIYDGNHADTSTLLFDNQYLLSNKEALPNLHKTVELTLEGHTWLLDMTAIANSNYEATFPNYLLWGGLLLTVLIFIIIYFLTSIRSSTYLKQLITDNATAGLFILNKKGYCTFMNPAACELTGYSNEELRAQRLYSLLQINPEDFSANNHEKWKLLKRLLAKGSVRNHSDTFYHKSGRKFYVNINGQPIKQHGRTVAYLVEIRDISQLIQHEQTLERQNSNLQILNNIGQNLAAELNLEKLLQTIIDASASLIGAAYGALYHRVDSQTPSIYVSFAGSEHDQIAESNKSVHSPLLFENFDKNDHILIEDLDKEKPIHEHLSSGMPLLHLPIRSYLAIPIISRNGSTTGGLYFGHPHAGAFSKNSVDIIRGIAAQASIAIDNSMLFTALSLKNDQLTRINNDLDNFVYTASHDLKAPVLNIEGLIHALTVSMKKQDSDKIDMIINMISISVQKFKETIVALTQIAETNKQPYEALEPIDFSSLLDDIILSIQEMIVRQHVQIEKHVDCAPFKFSKTNIRSIVMNLLTNAIKYRSPDRRPKISISCFQSDQHIIIKVQDNGLGIPDRVLSKIFMMFKRYHVHVEGSGIGLFLVKRIVDNYGGTINIESKEDQGSTFTVSLPIVL